MSVELKQSITGFYEVELTYPNSPSPDMERGLGGEVTDQR